MLSGIVTSILLALFVFGWAWMWRPSLKSQFDAASRLALDEGGSDANPQKSNPETHS
jgi:cytochrome c oxidase cbb3-type subunit 4